VDRAPDVDARFTRMDRRLLAAALLAALVLRLAFALGYWTGKPLTHDELEYLHLGHSLASGQGLRYTSEADIDLPNERYGRAPLYPIFIAALEWTLGHDAIVRNVRIAQAFAGTAAVLLLALLARRTAGPRAGLVAAWLAAIYPPLVWLCGFMLSESLYVVLALGTVLLLGTLVDDRAEPPSPSRDRRVGFAAGVLAGVAVLTRPAMLFFLVVAAVALLMKRRVRLVVVLALGSLLVVAPWTVRNVREYHRFILVASEGGITFWTGNHPLSPGEGDMAANPAIKLESRRLRAEHPSLTEEEMEPIYYREALAAIRMDPLWWSGLLIRKLFYTVVPLGPSYTLHSWLYRTASIVPYLLILPLGVLGLVQACRRGRTPRALLWLLASAVLVALVFLPQERFRIPVIDPALIVGTAIWVSFARQRAAV
jgi:4-amino-4-deoxy-L-arabinose transferase-like glycosyltransferase